jgi:hypothetical protein
MLPYRRFSLPPVTFRFGNGASSEKFGGLARFGPFVALPTGFAPRFVFVFPAGCNNYANRLYLALKNGVGYFRGVESAFRFRLTKDQVSSVTGFHLPPRSSLAEAARTYFDVLQEWLAKKEFAPDLVFILHPRTPRWETDSPYYRTKGLLLSHSLLSQDVTFDLLDDSSQFEWSAANIALSAFVNLGGTPWTIDGESSGDLVIGVGRSTPFDPSTRDTDMRVAFTTCFSTAGLFQFFSLGTVARQRQEYLASLASVVRDALSRAEAAGSEPRQVTIHMPTDMSRDEQEIVRQAAQVRRELPIRVDVVRVGDEESFFAVMTNGTASPAPPRGTVLRMSDRDYLLYTEGREEARAFRGRTPTGIRIARQSADTSDFQMMELVRQVNNLSQVNWRAFNARARPISVHYSMDIARILSRLPVDMTARLRGASVNGRMWFL